MNIHHLELFYYVAKYEGITPAVRKMPFGIQQPAVSGQLLQFEKDLGVKLFNRRPFALTQEGEELYDFAYPFFSRVDHVEARLKGQDRKHLKLAASATVLRTHLPALLESMKLRERDLRITLREAEPTNVQRMLVDQEVDIAVTALFGKVVEGLQSTPLMSCPLVLRVPEKWDVASFDDFIEEDEFGKTVGRVPLVAMPEHEVVTKIFRKGLKGRNVRWDTEVEVTSLDVVQRYAAKGFGAGLGVHVPGGILEPGLKEIPLTEFDDLQIGLVWQGKMRPMAEWFSGLAVEFVNGLEEGGK